MRAAVRPSVPGTRTPAEGRKTSSDLPSPPAPLRQKRYEPARQAQQPAPAHSTVTTHQARADSAARSPRAQTRQGERHSGPKPRPPFRGARPTPAAGSTRPAAPGRAWPTIQRRAGAPLRARSARDHLRRGFRGPRSAVGSSGQHHGRRRQRGAASISRRAFAARNTPPLHLAFSTGRDLSARRADHLICDLQFRAPRRCPLSVGRACAPGPAHRRSGPSRNFARLRHPADSARARHRALAASSGCRIEQKRSPSSGISGRRIRRESGSMFRCHDGPVSATPRPARNGPCRETPPAPLAQRRTRMIAGARQVRPAKPGRPRAQYLRPLCRQSHQFCRADGPRRAALVMPGNRQIGQPAAGGTRRGHKQRTHPSESVRGSTTAPKLSSAPARPKPT